MVMMRELVRSRWAMEPHKRFGAAAQAKGWSGEGPRSVAAVAEKRIDGCDEADDGNDGVQDAMTDDDA
eukprot:gene16476-biopygen4169